MKEEQLQSPIIRRMEREIDELKEKVDQLSKTKVIDSKCIYGVMQSSQSKRISRR